MDDYFVDNQIGKYFSRDD